MSDPTSPGAQPRRLTFWFLLLLVILLAGGGLLIARQRPASALPTPGPGQPGKDGAIPVERPVQVIALSGPLAKAEAEISGLGWYSDTLILLPQYPQRMDPATGGALFGLSRRQIDAYLSQAAQSQPPAPLQPALIPLDSGGIEKQIPGFEGFEAVAFHDQQVFLTIEARKALTWGGYLVHGQVDPHLKNVRLDPASLTENPSQVQQMNHSDEAMLVYGDHILTFYESNGAALNPQAHASVFDLQLTRLDPLPFPPLEYRLTDASPPDSQGRFWVINYFYSGDDNLRPTSDPLAEQYGKGPTHARLDIVERLVEYQITAQGIARTATPPVPLQLRSDGLANNWEGLVYLPGQGFLLATDKYPDTILGFVAYP